MNTKIYLLSALLFITSYSFGNNIISNTPKLKNNITTNPAHPRLTAKKTLEAQSIFLQNSLKQFMIGPMNDRLTERNNINLDILSSPLLTDALFPEFLERNIVQNCPTIDIEHEASIAFKNKNFVFCVNSDLYQEPLLTNPNIGFSVNSIIYQKQLNSQINLLVQSQPRIYVINYESTYIDEFNNTLFNFVSPAQSLDYFAPELNLGIVIETNKFSIEYSRTTNLTEWGEIEIQLLLI